MVGSGNVEMPHASVGSIGVPSGAVDRFVGFRTSFVEYGTSFVECGTRFVGRLAQLVRALPLQGRSPAFESPTAH